MLHLLCFVLPGAFAADDDESTVAIGVELRGLALELPDAAREALRTQDWEAAVPALRSMSRDTLQGDALADWSFLVAWSASRAGAPAQAEDVLDKLGGGSAPEAYVAVARGLVLQSVGRSKQALRAFGHVDPSAAVYPTAALGAADALRALDRPDEAWSRLEQLVQRSDPRAGNAEVLLAVALHHGPASEAAYPLLRRLWVFYPETDEGARAAQLLGGHDKPPATWQEVAKRAERWMAAEEYDRAIDETEPYLAHASDESVDGCRLRYTRGRSHYKRNRLSASVQAMGDIGRQCVKAEGTYGQRGLYLVGTAQFRRKEFEASAAAYRQLAELYPGHSMADDAWTRGGISLLEGGDAKEAEVWWARALDEYPDGDTVPEAALRLAFARYDAGHTDDAIAIAERLTKLPVEGNAAHVEAGRYWSARWRMYGDAEDPRTPVSDEGSRAAAIEGWRTLCVDVPHSFYAILAYSRLREVAPDVAIALGERPVGHTDGSEVVPWQVRLSSLKDPHFRDGVALMRLGLVTEAMAEWSDAGPRGWTADEKAWTIELRIAAGDWLFAHDDLRSWIIEHPLGTLGPREPQIVRLAWPDRFWDEVRASVTADYVYEARLLHGLVREESNFNQDIISFAGAIGLSQLMWRTAQQTAGWLKMDITKADLFDPPKNLRIGARYLDQMHRQLSSSPFLALAAYNGGASNVKGWVAEHGNPPVDEWVERVPFRETRGYVKRVMGSWQTMRYHFDAVAPYPDLSAYNHRVLP